MDLPVSSIPAPQMALARLRLKDITGLILGGLGTPADQALRQVLNLYAAPGPVSMAGADTPRQDIWAALAHGTLAHCWDYDDTFAESVVHPGCTVVPVALAVGEAEGRTDEEILAAIVIGYEVAGRLGIAGGRRLHARGFHASGVYGPLTAAIVAGRLIGASPEHVAEAMGLAGSMSGGLLEFVADGTWSKWLHLGWSAMGGIVATRLAASGFHGAQTVLEGRFGLYAAFAGEGAELDRITAGLGSRWEGDSAAPKYYPCAHVTQPYIDMALALAVQHDLKPAQIAGVTCVVADWAVPIVCEPAGDKKRPRTNMQAIASLPWFVATALADRIVGLDTIGDAFRARADLLDLAQRIEYRVDPALGRSFDGGLEILLKDGSTLRITGGMGGLDPAKLDRKFRGLAARGLSDADVESLALCLDGPDGGKRDAIAAAFKKASARN